jgi:hypothetical protein
MILFSNYIHKMMFAIGLVPNAQKSHPYLMDKNILWSL